MRPPRCSKGLVLIAAVLSTAAMALEFRSITEHGVSLTDTPSTKGKVLYVATRGLPVEILVEQGEWLRVRESGGALAWVPRSKVGPIRTLIVTKANAEIRQSADPRSPLIAMAGPQLLLNLIEQGKNGWVKVSHRDGLTGFIRIEEVWGL